jgi:hypothetical protein
MALSCTGRILFVDDKYDDDIRRAITTLIEKGVPVQFWDSKGEPPDLICNIRIIILDLDLAGLGTKTYDLAVEALHKIPGPFIVIIMALNFEEDDPSILKSTYESSYNVPLCGFIAKEGLTKKEESEDPIRLQQLILSSIIENKILDLILLWEGLVDKAKDAALSNLLENKVENTILILIKTLCKEMGEEAAARELVNIMMRLISRRTGESKNYCSLISLIKRLNKELMESTEYPSEEDLEVYSKLMFYRPNPEEGIWTGDIYKTIDTPKFDEYAMILTPRCDLAQHKVAKVVVCFAFKIDEKYFSDPEYPPNFVDPMVIEKREKGEEQEKIRQFIEKRYSGRMKLPENLQILWNFKHKNETFGLCFDFNNVRSIKTDELQTWERVCRLDSLYIEDLLRKYGNTASRIGVININMSPKALRAALDELTEEQSP